MSEKRPRRGAPLIFQVFLSILTTTLGSLLITGLLIRTALTNQFEAYLSGLPATSATGMRMGMGRRLLGAAEQTFIQHVDNGIIIAALVAVVIAAVGALLLARYISRPITSLGHGVREFGSGSLSHRVDVTGPAEVSDLATAFNDMADSLSNAEELRRRLVADVAHELRNPVAALRAQLEGVAEGVLPMTPERAGSLVGDVAHLSRLVDDLQELSIAEAGQLPYAFAETNLTLVAQREAERARPLASATVAVHVTSEPDPVIAEVDELRVAQVLKNLLSNALRHTREGSIEVGVSVHGDFARVAVADTGEGIPESDLPYIFERFYRADSARAADTGGAGIGLAIARRIVEDHGGSMFAESREEGGAVVGFELPLTRDAVA